MKRLVAGLVKFGLGGDSVECYGGAHCSGYGSPERPHCAAPSDTLEIPDGTPALDIRAAVETEAGYRWVFRGPMVSVDLADEETTECPMPDGLFASALMTGGGAYGPLVAQHIVSRKSGQRSGLDFVSVREYVAGWRAVGARVGEYRGGVIVWEDAK